MRTRQRRLAGITAALLLAVLVTGCSASSGGSAADSAQQARPAAPVPASADDQEQSAVVITGTVTITSDDPIAAAEKATEIAEDVKGRVDARDESAPRDGGIVHATVTLRVPADSVEEVRARLAKLGHVDETVFSSADVGSTQRDLNARITTLQASIARYDEWLRTATATSDLLELESAISDRQSELETLQAQQRDLADQVALSTITVTFRSEWEAPKTGPKNLIEGVVVGWNGFVGFWSEFLVLLGIALPWLLLCGLIAAAIIWFVRRSSRRAALRPAAVPPSPPAAQMPAPPRP